MCSFIFSTKCLQNYNFNQLMKLRGPDATHVNKVNGHFYCHNLLSIRGDYIRQPFVSDDEGVLIMFNGEIYNCPDDYSSEGLFIYDLYMEHGTEFCQELDGEYSIILVDYRINFVLAARDAFGTKPLYFGVNKEHFGFATYASALRISQFNEINKIPANKKVILTLDRSSIIQNENYRFNLAQHKNELDAWSQKFDEAIKKRVKHVRGIPFIGLSSGYDSGAIAASLIKNNISFDSYSIRGVENEDILNSREDIIKKSGNKAYGFQDTLVEKNIWRSFIKDYVENEKYCIETMDGQLVDQGLSVHSDNASVLLAFICSKAREKQSMVYLSGSGADEIYSDYGFGGEKIYEHSNFGGRYPETLLGFFPWRSFYGSTQAAYLAKEEMVAGAFGIETRYPFLDVALVQEFLALTSEAKNSVYKSVIANYLNHESFPYNKNEKIGFNFSKEKHKKRGLFDLIKFKSMF